LVLIVGDHGEHFGEHGLLSHANSLYMPLLHVPLVLLFPGKVPEGKVVLTPVSLRDLAATVIDLLNLSERPIFPGASLARHFQKEGSPATTLGDEGILSWVKTRLGDTTHNGVFVAGKVESLVLDGHHYVCADGREELYSLDDPLEEHDLAPVPANRQVVERLRIALRKMLSDKGVA
jgi:arylsulfatase A-like enzyme